MEKLYSQAKDNKSIINILDYLKDFASKDSTFSEKLKIETKNVDNMMKYIMTEAKKLATNGNAIVEDATVYDWAIHYFDEKDENLNINQNIQGEVKSTLSDSQKEKNAIENTKVMKQMKKEKKVEKAIEKEQQLSIFDLGL